MGNSRKALQLCNCLALALVLNLIPHWALATENWCEVRSPHFIVNSNAGEKEARRIANQFEEIRSVYLLSFPSLHVDFGKPFIIIGVKNEDSSKLLFCPITT
jgi:hypothetical protein